MKISWGVKVTILYIGFVLLILGMVTLSMRQKVDLVAGDYYEQELRYQEKIDRIINSNALKKSLRWEVQQEAVKLNFPREFNGQNIKGSIYFFRPSDVALDQTFSISVDSSGVQIVAINQLKKGLYKMQISWDVDQEKYYNEGTIQIN